MQETGKVPRIRELTDDDVLLGRGFPAIENEGNVRFRELVRTRSAEYHAAYRRHTKDSIARNVVDTIQQRGGRFLTQVDSLQNIRGVVLPAGARVWSEADEAAVLIKAKQALRDHSENSKEGKQYTRRRPAAGSGNVVIEWVTPTTSSLNESVNATNASAASTPAVTAAAASLDRIGGSMAPQPDLSSLLSSQQLPFVNPGINSLGHFNLLSSMGNIDPANTALLGAALQQQQNFFGSTQMNHPHAAATALSPASLQFALQQLSGNQGQAHIGGLGANAPGSFTGLVHESSKNSVTMQGRSFETQVTRVTGSDTTFSSSQHQPLSSSSTSVASLLQGGGANRKAGSRASMAIDRGIESY